MPPQVEYDHPEKGGALYAFELSLSLEKLNNDRLLSLHAVAATAMASSCILSVAQRK